MTVACSGLPNLFWPKASIFDVLLDTAASRNLYVPSERCNQDWHLVSLNGHVTRLTSALSDLQTEVSAVISESGDDKSVLESLESEVESVAGRHDHHQHQDCDRATSLIFPRKLEVQCPGIPISLPPVPAPGDLRDLMNMIRKGLQKCLGQDLDLPFCLQVEEENQILTLEDDERYRQIIGGCSSSTEAEMAKPCVVRIVFQSEPKLPWKKLWPVILPGVLAGTHMLQNHLLTQALHAHAIKQSGR
mmetsp:Transcript_968/g.1995  ORF Transcript_968/g.1995 Transcript_968/m.1995 type:complete len:246 (-) Transcript_968:418-1155(-)